MNSDSQSENEQELSSETSNQMTCLNHAPPEQHSQHDQQKTNMPMEEWKREGDSGCNSSPGQATRRLRILWTLLVAVAIFGISAFGSSAESPTERAVIKQQVFDVNAPPGLEERVYRKQVYATEEDIRLAEGNNSELPFAVIEADDDIPLSNLQEKAVDALECRESVINFVINATDAKDECNGLKKAFDMTCNSESDAAKTSADPEKSNTRQRRRLFEASTIQKTRFTSRLYQTTRSLRDFARAHLWPRKEGELFFPEDEIVGDSWEEARYQVLNDYDTEVHEPTRRRLASEAKSRHSTVSEMRFLEEYNATSMNATVAGNETVVSKPTDKKKVSLSMPTNKLHASDQMLSDTVMLGKEKDIQEAIKVSSNQTNITLSAAQEDAAASAKAVHDTAAAISAVLNDPESVEARTCCASILNVYHEHCDTSESNQVVSDSNLIIIVFIIAVCGAVKSMIRHFKIRWLPEAAGCILVGILFGGVMSFIPHYNLSFDHDWFLRIMVPPIGE